MYRITACTTQVVYPSRGSQAFPSWLMCASFQIVVYLGNRQNPEGPSCAHGKYTNLSWLVVPISKRRSSALRLKFHVFLVSFSCLLVSRVFLVCFSCLLVSRVFLVCVFSFLVFSFRVFLVFVSCLLVSRVFFVYLSCLLISRVSFVSSFLVCFSCLLVSCVSRVCLVSSRFSCFSCVSRVIFVSYYLWCIRSCPPQSSQERGTQ